MPGSSTECVFCRIARHESEASIVYQDDQVTAFMDHRPVNPGHCLVIPNVHAAVLAHLSEEHAERMFAIGVMLGGALRRSSLRCEGVNLFLSDGPAAGQTVFHCHLHVLPRFRGDRFRIPVGMGRTTSRSELETQAEQITAALHEG
jgi:histidine triad (HIT) family protein